MVVAVDSWRVASGSQCRHAAVTTSDRGLAQPSLAEPRHSVAGILARYLPDVLARSHIDWHQRRVLEKLITCRTPQAGGHAWVCTAGSGPSACGHVSADYNSCGDRHCLGCSHAHKMGWLEQVQEATLPCLYLHIVLTVPHELNALIAANPQQMYDLVFYAGTQAMLRHWRKVLGVTPSIIAALHTWGQAMLHHVHTHNVVTSGGLSLDGTQWIDIDPRDARIAREPLAARYRWLFLDRLKKVYQRGTLLLPPSMAWINSPDDLDAWLAPIVEKNWMVNVGPPPAGAEGPDTVLGYLGRYVSGTAIGDTRILDDDGTHVTILIKNYREGGCEESLTMTGVEFVRRFTLHILPPHYRRIRYAGLVAQRKRKACLAHCRELLADRVKEPSAEVRASDAPSEDVPDEESQDQAPTPPKRCPRCRATEFVFIECYLPGESYEHLLPAGMAAACNTVRRDAGAVQARPP